MRVAALRMGLLSAGSLFFFGSILASPSGLGAETEKAPVNIYVSGHTEDHITHDLCAERSCRFFPPIELFKISLLSKNVEAIGPNPNDSQIRQADPLTKQQFWTFKPARWK